MVVIQHIETVWLKNERGAQHGTLRGKTPTAVALPAGACVANQADVLLHHVRYARASPATEERVTVSATAPLKVGCVMVTPTDGGAQLRYEWTPYCGGNPRRSRPYGPWKTTLGRGQWCQVRYNGRVVTETTWRYHITTVNIGVFAQVLEDAFLAGVATTHYEDLVELR